MTGDTQPTKVQRPAKPTDRRLLILVAVLFGCSLVTTIGGGSWYYFYGPCGVVVVERAEQEIDTVFREWNDAIQVAASTGKAFLSGPVERLQQVRRDVEAIEVPRCLRDARAYLVLSIDESNRAFLSFMANGNTSESDRRFRQSEDYLDIYASERVRVSSCVPFCN